MPATGRRALPSESAQPGTGPDADHITSTTPTGFRIPGLDGLRAFAVFTVFVGHAGLRFVIGAGSGVTVFFFLSGYLITTLLRRERAKTGTISLRDFYLRRVLRIFPPMYIFVAFASIITVAGLVAGHLYGYGYLSALAYITNFVEIWGTPHHLIPGAGLLWSLAIEEHFYLVFPPLYLAMTKRLSRRWQSVVLLSLCLLTMAWRMVLVLGFGDGYNRTYYGTDTRADSLLAGCLLAIALNPVLDPVPERVARWLRNPRREIAAFLGGCLLIAGGEHLAARPAAMFESTIQLTGLFIAFFIILRNPKSLMGRLLELRPVVRLGVLSYSFYLFHGVIIEVFQQKTGLSPIEIALVVFVITWVICEAVNQAVEQPAARLRRRLTHDRGPRPAVESPGVPAVGALLSE